MNFADVGGTAFTPMGADPLDMTQTHWNFGVAGRPGLTGPKIMTMDRPSFHTTAPYLAGRWDGSSTICLPEIERKVLGNPIPAQYQRRGTCGGRAGSGMLDSLQCLLMAGGQRAKFYRASHAWLYYLARKKYGMIGGGDGVPDGSIQEILAETGALQREEANDLDADSPSTDNLAVKWGAQGMPNAEHVRLAKLASDNLVRDTAPCKSSQEVADALASGAAILVSDAHGFTMTRDNYGYCQRSGVWYHYHGISGVFKTADGRKGFAYKQSWGENNPEGPKLLNGMFPGHYFGITWDAMQEICIEANVVALFSFELWDKSASKDVDWEKVFGG